MNNVNKPVDLPNLITDLHVHVLQFQPRNEKGCVRVKCKQLRSRQPAEIYSLIRNFAILHHVLQYQTIL